jgi:hypothetical protein
LTIAAFWAAEKWRRSRRDEPFSWGFMGFSFAGRYANVREEKLQFRLRQDTL